MQKKRIAKHRKKLYVFDLDRTLWDGRELYPNVKDILQYLHQNNHFVYLATYNGGGPQILRNLGIVQYFDGGTYGYVDGRKKSTSVAECIHHVKHKKNYLPLEIYFFDDLYDNINDVNSSLDGRVKAIQTPNGLNWRHITEYE